MRVFRRRGDARGAALPALIEALRALFARGCEVPARQVHEIAARRRAAGAPRSSCRPGRPAATTASRSSTSRPATPPSACPALHASYLLYDATTGVPLAFDRRRRDHGAAHRRDVGAGGLLARAGRRAPPRRDRRRPGRAAAADAHRAVRPIDASPSGRARRRPRRLVAELAGRGFDARVAASSRPPSPTPTSSAARRWRASRWCWAAGFAPAATST